jgi:hypothetical protein
MNFFSSIQIKKLQPPIKYGDYIFLIGSCFSEHISNALAEHKFNVLQNPNGILFDPAAVCNSLLSYIENKSYNENDLMYLNELWQSWQHHSKFSSTNKNEILKNINESRANAHEFLKKTNRLIITLGSSFLYRLNDHNPDEKFNRMKVANCHRAPARWFDKEMMPIDEIIALLENTCQKLFSFNADLKILFTISPVRHLRDGTVENNRSKARLIEAVHHIVDTFSQTDYFPAYELLIDILRDYRFYDIDLAHPNYIATEFVLEKFTEHCINESDQQLMKEIKEIVMARKHKPFQPDTLAHKTFLKTYYEKTKALAEKYPMLNVKEDMAYFGNLSC